VTRKILSLAIVTAKKLLTAKFAKTEKKLINNNTNKRAFLCALRGSA